MEAIEHTFVEQFSMSAYTVLNSNNPRFLVAKSYHFVLESFLFIMATISVTNDATSYTEQVSLSRRRWRKDTLYLGFGSTYFLLQVSYIKLLGGSFITILAAPSTCLHFLLRGCCHGRSELVTVFGCLIFYAGSKNTGTCSFFPHALNTLSTFQTYLWEYNAYYVLC